MKNNCDGRSIIGGLFVYSLIGLVGVLIYGMHRPNTTQLRAAIPTNQPLAEIQKKVGQ